MSIRLPRPLWFFLGTVVLVVTAIGLRLAERQRTIRAIQGVGGDVAFQPPFYLPESSRKRLREWKITLFDEVSDVNFRDYHFPGGKTPSLSGLRSLRCAFLDRATLTDARLAELENCKDLECLSLDGTNIADADLAHVERFAKLQFLQLSNTSISDEGLSHLKGLPKLWCLDVTGTHVSDAGLKHLKSVAGLRMLITNDTDVTDEGAADLKRALLDIVVVVQPR
jgi:hypothetical protein